jgi:hypothetical protein
MFLLRELRRPRGLRTSVKKLRSTLLLLLATLGSAYARPELVVLVDGKPVEFKTARPQVIGGRTVVPLRGVFEAIGAYVEYDPANRIIKAKRNNEVVELKLDDRVAKKNGAEIIMDAKAQIYAGTTMVPLRFISEALGAKVEYDKANNRINITTPD